MEVENEDLRAANDDLVLKLKKSENEIDMREAAIEEAVGMICQLEARIEDLERNFRNNNREGEIGVPSHLPRELQATAPKTPPQTEYGPKADEDPLDHSSKEAPLKTDTLTGTSSKSSLRPPLFLRDNKRSTLALRSLYSSRNPSFASLQRPSSIFSDEELEEEMDRQMLNSPRLSILSESGFSSIYGNPREQTASPQLEAGSANNSCSPKAISTPSQRNAQREARISDWVRESQRLERPKTPARRPPNPTANDRFSSIGELLQDTSSVSKETNVVSIPPQPYKSPASSEPGPHEQRLQEQRSPTRSLRKSARAHGQLSSQAGSIFSSRHLPPTPDTMSTVTIGGNSSTQSIVTEKSMADNAAVPANGYGFPVQDDRPQSSDSRLEYQISQGVNDNADNGSEKADNDLESMLAERSEFGLGSNVIGFPGAPSYVGGSCKATRFFGNDTLIRPSLTTYATDMMFNGDGYSPKQPSRMLSYPSPTGSSRCASNQLSPSSKRSSGVPSERTITSPRRSSPAHSRSPASLQFTGLDPQDAEVQTETDSKHRRNLSLRLRLPRLSSANPTGNQSVTSRMFRRTNVQATNTLPATEGTNLPRPVSRDARTALPRPSSLYGQPSPSGTLKSMLPADMLTDISHLAPRPGTADGTSNDCSISNRKRHQINMRRHSAIVDDSVMVGLDKREAPSSPVYDDGDHQQKRDSGLRCVVDAESGLRRVGESRQAMRGNEENRQGKRGLGRAAGAAGAKIREGLGFKR